MHFSLTTMCNLNSYGFIIVNMGSSYGFIIGSIYGFIIVNKDTKYICGRFVHAQMTKYILYMLLITMYNIGAIAQNT